MARAHYIVRVGNSDLARTTSTAAPNHWHYLSTQRLWGFPKAMTVVKVRHQFFADIANPATTTYIWFLCNSHGGQPGHFVEVAIGAGPHGGPVPNARGDGGLQIPDEMMTRLQEGFDHWFRWRPVPLDARLEERLTRIPAPKPTYIPTLRHVTADHASFPTFEALIDDHERQHHNVVAALSLPAQQSAIAASPRAREIRVIDAEKDLENLRRERTEPESRGYVYLIHMTDTMYYKIGMSFDPDLRLKTLQTGNPHNLALVITSNVDDMHSAENSLHRRFEAQRIPNSNAREWFDFGFPGLGGVRSAFEEIGNLSR